MNPKLKPVVGPDPKVELVEPKVVVVKGEGVVENVKALVASLTSVLPAVIEA